MEIKEKIKEICNKSVKDRDTEEHIFLVNKKYGGSVRDYLLSMGDFKDEFQELVKEKLKKIKNERGGLKNEKSI